jgi:poly-gamma-glutamate synthesis protein (capsule biosynthesis protein)
MEDKQFTFRINPRYTKLFQDMQLDIVTLANNHVLDYGEEALLDTFTALDNAKIKYVGAGKNISEAKAAETFQINDKNIAILSASRVIPVATWNAGNSKPGLLTTYDPSILIDEINKAKKTSDYIIVYVHWGIERHSNPEEYQRKLAKQYIDAGADLVVGSHPHVLQGIEYYKDKPIIYSLGNFMFYNTINQTALLKVTVNESNETQLQLLPCKAINGQTDLVNNTVEKDDFYKYLTSISYEITFDKNGIVSH